MLLVEVVVAVAVVVVVAVVIVVVVVVVVVIECGNYFYFDNVAVHQDHRRSGDC